MGLRLTQPGDTITVKDTELAVPNPIEGVSYTLRLITRKDYQEIEKPHKRKKANSRTHVMEEIIDYDGVADDLTDFVLQGWEGVLVGEPPVPAECSRENKLALDILRRRELHDLAGLSRVQAADTLKASSFRGTEAVRGGLGGRAPDDAVLSDRGRGDARD